ncbi:hypothetical protein GCM10008022_31460 [Paenibacillus hunanensis]|nr:hypothetical protein GCM10008022_31460 [Paenibacillus hunanensis]
MDRELKVVQAKQTLSRLCYCQKAIPGISFIRTYVPFNLDSEIDMEMYIKMTGISFKHNPGRIKPRPSIKEGDCHAGGCRAEAITRAI